jgi:cardiolipin synthase
MLQAAKRGVRVKVIAAGRSDVLVSKHAERWLYDWLLRNNIELYEYKSNILHGKLAVCDDQLLTLGSYNINNISAYATIECNLNVKDAPFIQTVHTLLEQIIANDCEKITSEQLVKSRNVFIRFTRWISYQFVRLLIYLFTFYFKHKP